VRVEQEQWALNPVSTCSEHFERSRQTRFSCAEWSCNRGTLADLPFLADSSLNDWAVSRQLPHTAKAHVVVLVVGANYQ